MDTIEDHFDSKFRFVLLSARRAEQLIRGANPRVESRTKKVARLAMSELLAGRVEWGYGPPPESEPAAESVEAEGSSTASGDGDVH